MQLHGYLQDLRQGDDSVTTYQQKAKGSLMNSQPQVAPSPSRTSIYMSCRVSIVTFVILLPVYRQKLTLYRILSFIATYPHMNFYIRALSNIVPQLHRYCQRLHNPLLPLLSSRPFQELMAMVLPSSEVEEDIMVGETYAPPAQYGGNNFRGGTSGHNWQQHRGNWQQHHQELQQNRSTAGQWGRQLKCQLCNMLDIPHSSAHSLCTMGIKHRLISSLVTHQQPQILSLAFLTLTQLSMLLSILPI
jgi:hypothetical protein